MYTVPPTVRTCTTGTGQNVDMPCRNTSANRPTIITTASTSAPPFDQIIGKPYAINDVRPFGPRELMKRFVTGASGAGAAVALIVDKPSCGTAAEPLQRRCLRQT